MKLNTECYVLPYPEVNDDDTEELPAFAAQNNLEFIYRDEMLQDVIAAAVDEDKNISKMKKYICEQYGFKYGIRRINE